MLNLKGRLLTVAMKGKWVLFLFFFGLLLLLFCEDFNLFHSLLKSSLKTSQIFSVRSDCQLRAKSGGISPRRRDAQGSETSGRGHPGNGKRCVRVRWQLSSCRVTRDPF